MRNWKLVKKQFLSGKTPKELEAIHAIPAKSISTRAYKYKWVSERDAKNENLADKYQNEIEIGIDLSFSQLKRIINDPTAANRDIIAAAKLYIDMSGLLKQTIKNDVTMDKNIEVIINRNAIKPLHIV